MRIEGKSNTRSTASDLEMPSSSASVGKLESPNSCRKQESPAAAPHPHLLLASVESWTGYGCSKASAATPDAAKTKDVAKAPCTPIEDLAAYPVR